MKQIALLSAATLAATIASTDAYAFSNRTFVSGNGNDSNPCSLTAPCRSFAGAIAQTSPGGEIAVLDTAGYGAVTIGKSITITNPGGVEAGITTTAGQTAITINPSSSVVVTLRGLTLEGGGVGQNGIVLASTAQGTLNIIDCVVQNFVGIGIAITPLFSGPETRANVLIANSFVLNNAGGGIEIFPQNISTLVAYAIDHTTVAGSAASGGNVAGILVNSSAGFLTGSFSSVHAQMNNVGANFIGTGFAADAIVKNSVLTGNTTNDLANTSGEFLYLYDSNQINRINNGQTINSDGTNNVLLVVGNPLTPVNRQ
jgi:hypothetical protein